jgi:hypothetical protein
MKKKIQYRRIEEIKNKRRYTKREVLEFLGLFAVLLSRRKEEKRREEKRRDVI